MLPIMIEGANIKLVGSRPGVQPLYVHFNEGVFYSRWEPTPEELILLNAGGSVELAVISANGHHPPVSLIATPHSDQ